jgi:hypothetical protein
MSTLIPLIELNALPDGSGCRVRTAGLDLAVFRTGGDVYAIDDSVPTPEPRCVRDAYRAARCFAAQSEPAPQTRQEAVHDASFTIHDTPPAWRALPECRSYSGAEVAVHHQIKFVAGLLLALEHVLGRE